MLQITPDPDNGNWAVTTDNNHVMYEIHMTSYISVATIMSAIAGIKMTYILGKK